MHTTLVLFTLIGILNSSNVLAQSSIDWSTANWPQGSTSGTVNLTTPAGFKQESVTINITRNTADGNFYSSAATGTFPKIDLASGGLFGGVDDLGVAFDPADTGRANANSPVRITLNFSQNITNLRFGISDIDHSNGRVDRVTVTSNAGSPNSITIVDPPNTTVTSTTINSAQSSTASADSNNNDNGSIIVDFGSKSVRTVTIVYTDNNNSSGPRGTGFLGNFTLTTANIIDAVNDSATTTYGIGGTAVNNVLSNDILKTVAPTLSTVNLTQVSTTNSNISLNTSTGEVNVSPNTPVGTYTLVYQICEKASTSNCDTASVTITVTPPDNDNDGIADDVDLDDDNDGILDTDEGYTCPSSNYVNLGQSFTNANTNTNGGTNSGTVLNTYSFNDANATLSYEVTNGATWSSGVASAGPTTGVDGNYVNVQSKDTNFPYGSNYQNNASSIKVAVYTLTFNKPVYNLELKWSGLDNQDRVDFIGSLDGTNVPLVVNNNTLPNNTFLIENQSVYSIANAGNAPNNGVIVSTAQPINKITFVTGKYNGNAGNVTMQLYELKYCLAPDTDGDGIADYLDLDSDNDGITDVIESGGTDTNRDGQADGNVGTSGSTNGVPSSAGTGNTPANSDSDTLPNHLDIDADNDGIPDNIEGQTSNGYIAPSGIANNITDTNNNGVDDNYESGAIIGFDPENTDGIDNPDYLDLDSDNDGITDIRENGNDKNSLTGSDSDNDGLDNAFDDNDDSSISGATVNDGLNSGNKVTDINSLENAYGDNDDNFNPGDGDLDYRDFKDSDKDGIVDSDDLDDDNDGILDTVEIASCVGSLNYEFYDSVPSGNTVDNIPTTGATATGTVTNFDVTALQEMVTPSDNQTYSIRYSGYINIPSTTNYTFYLNSDDGSKLFIDGNQVVDYDGLHGAGGLVTGDNIPLKEGLHEITVLFFENTGAHSLDVEYSSSTISRRNLPFSILSPNCDTDGDGISNHLDIDADNDGIPDNIEGQTSNDYVAPSGIGTSITDSNNNGVDDNYENGQVGLTPVNTDASNDSIPDYLDLDSDNDGIDDVLENGDTDNGASGNDTDGDGLDDNFDDNNDSNTEGSTVNDGLGSGNKVTNAATLDTAYGDQDNDFPGSGDLDYRDKNDIDNDGVADLFDLDNDNDGIPDVDEMDCSGNNLGNSAPLLGAFRDNIFWLNWDGDFTNGINLGDSKTFTMPDGSTITATVVSASAKNGLTTDFVPVDMAAWDANPNPHLKQYYDTTPDNEVIYNPSGKPSSEIDFTIRFTGLNNNIVFTPNLVVADGESTDEITEKAQYYTSGTNWELLDNIPNTFTNSSINAKEAFLEGNDTGSGGNGFYVLKSNKANTIRVVLKNTVNGSSQGVAFGIFLDCLPIDSDNDGIPNHLDLDSDNDGIPDIVEAGGTDTNGDGKVDNINANGTLINDANNNGLDDLYDVDNGGNTIPNLDSDGDGVPNTQDLDSDNDGIADIVEAGGTDTNGDGKADNFVDTDNDGFNDVVDGDVGQDGTSENTDNALIVTGADTNNDGTPNSYPNGDTDNDGILDHLDLDADNDGIADVVEAGGTDTNGDGKADNFTDADNDGFNDVVDGDPTNALANGSDANGANTDNALIVTGADTNNDGTPNSYPNGDTDNDGILDHLDLDADNDGIADVVEAGGTDTNGDGKADNFTDADNDGFNDVVDGDPTNALANGSDANGANTDNALIVTGADTNNDGTPNSYPNGDTDNDGILDHLDLDSDNDGIADVVEAGGTDTNGDGKADNFTDADNDGFNDVVDGDPTNALANGSDANGANTDNALIVTGADTNNDGTPNSYPNGDTDNDGILDHLDLDSDNDGIADVVEAGGTDTNGDGKADNFTDADNDGFNDVVDGDPTNALANGSDANGANTDNALIVTGADTNNDGTPNSYPNGDTDNDGILDHLDLDADNDGIADVVEAGGTDTNGDGKADNFTDADNDGFNDVVDGDPTNALANGSDANGANTDNALIVTGADTNNDGTPNSYPNGDTDNDGILDHLDLDSDNDGIADVVEAGGTDTNGDGKADNFTDADNDGFNDVVDGDPTNALANGSDANGANTDNALIVTGADTNNDGTPNSYPNGDTDNDGILDHLDLDADNDGIADVVEAGGTDTNGDGKADNFTDADNDGFNDVVDGDPTNALANGSDANGANTDNALIVTGADTNNDGTPNSYPNGDTDNDGILDHLDLDSDNDGIADVVEAGGTDTNGDGKADNFTDADNDGFNDVVDGDPTNALANGSDANGANTDNALIVTGADTNNDGTPNSYPNGDTDNDGILDHLDLDADNDGIADVVEAGGTDTNGDGKADNFTDADNDGFNDVVDGDPTNALANGSDANGANTDNALIVTGDDTNNDGTPNSYPNGDTDNDGKLDFIDIDADNDGIPDNIEGQTSSDYVAPSGIGSSITDANNNGVDDNYEDGQIGLTPVNTDSSVDNIPDYLDSDSDNDGILDIVENGDTDNVLSGSDIDNDGLDDNFDDNNDTSIQGSTVNDGLGNSDKVTNITNLENAYGDADNDFPGAGDLDYRDTSDRDNDGIADNIDIDDDNDGILDLVENGNNDADGDEDGDGTPNYRDTTDNGNAGDGSVTNYTDSNSDGIPDVYDFDNDGIANHIDLDADNDGIPDNIEGQSTIDYVAPSGNDTDNDGLDDAYDATPNGNANGLGSLGLTPVNTDASAAVGSDTTPDYLDLDSDGDGLFDVVESGAGLPNDGNGTSTGTFGANGLNDLAETGNTDLGYTDINGEYDNTQTDNFDDNDQDVLTVGDVNYRDITDDGIPMITQVYQFEAERWIEITNIHPTKSIAANLINIQLYKDKTGAQTTAPDVTHTVTSALAPGQSVIFGNSNNTLTNINSNAIAVKNNDLTDISGANDIITLSKVNGVSSYENRYDIIESFNDKTSYVRIDETLQPNVNYTESEWVVFVDDALDPYNFLIDSAERHPHDPLISEIESSNSDANTLLGLHRIEKTTRTGGNWNNGYPDRSRYVSVNENYEHQNERLSARKLEILGSNILAIDNQLLVVTNNLNITTNAEIRLVGKSQFVQTHTGVADITGNGKMYVEQNSELANIYRYNYMSSPVRTVDLQTYSIESVLKDGTNPVSFAGIVGQGASNIARDINFVGGYDGSTGTPINIADYWIYTFASTRGQRSNYEHKYKSGTIAPTDGYIFKGPEVAQNYTFVGNPNDGELTTAVGGSDSYLIGNPFPSAMNALKFIKDNINSIDGSLYFWDHVGEENTNSETSGHNYQGYVGGYSTINLSMAVASLGKPAVGAFSITLEAEQATTNTSSITDQSREVVRLNTSIEFLEFNRITRATDEININYKSATGKTLVFLKDNVEVGTYDLPATSGYETFTINDCVIVGSTIRFESLDSKTIDIDFIEMNDDDGDVSCAPSSGTDSSLFKTPGTYIPIGQGFFIGGDSDGGPIVFNNSQRQYVTEDSGNAVFFKSTRKKVVEQDNGDFNTLPLLKIGMDFVSEDREPLHRQIGVSFSPNNTFEFEKGFDSPINDLGATDVYWKFENSDNKYVIAGIQSVSNSLEIPFEIIMDYKGAVILNLDDIKKVNNTIFVKDKLNNKTYDITNNEVVLQLDKGEYLNRFSIVFSQDTVLSVDDANLENPINDLITTFLDKTTKELVIDNKNNLNIENVVLFNLLGQKTNSWNIDSTDSENRLKVKNIANGVYIVNIKTEKGVISKKVLYNK
ncbi:PA14 domain-containing protein [Polaribacter marinaquae]|uniref:PA14 domain-containing protein n=3 Tax=Polaribacter marinaquae TaxID=1642819 RepID=A0ABZ2TRQ3_9FLAO